jgi:homospermidine synthase
MIVASDRNGNNTNNAKNNKNNKNNKNINANKLKFSVDLEDRSILQIGCGGVGSSMPPLYVRHMKFKPGNITIIDKDKSRIDKLAKKFPTINFVSLEITKTNYKSVVEKYLKRGDIFVDLAWYISTNDLLTLCHEKDLHFVNTAIEQWYGDNDCKEKTNECETLYRHQHAVRKMAVGWGNKGATAVVGHGANPGWISHAAKIGIADWVNYLAKKNATDSNVKKAMEYLKEDKLNEVARLLNIQVIHISERDTQISNVPKKVGEFLCTWSPTGLIEEGSLPAEMGWGTHETMTEYIKHFKSGPGNEVYMDTIAMNTTVKSYVPGSEVLGYVIPHEEANSLSYFFTVKKGGKVTYRPTVHYAYMLPDVAIASLVEYQANGMPDSLKSERVIKDEIASGADTLGVLFMSPKYGKWWTGSDLDIETSRKLIPHQNATVVQVSPSVLGAIIYALQNPNLSPIFPEDMNSNYIMNMFIKPYLGRWLSKPVMWEPSTKGVPEKYKREKNFVFQRFLVSPPITQ